MFFIQRIQALQKLENTPKKLKNFQTQKSRKDCETQKTAEQIANTEKKDLVKFQN